MSDSIRDAFDDSADALGRELREEAEKLSRFAEDGFTAASEAVDDASDALKDGLRRTRKTVGDAGRRVSGAIDDSAEYLRSKGPRGLFDEVESFVRQNPAASMLAVAATAFLLGTSMRRRL